MKIEDLLEHRANLAARLEAIETEKLAITRKLKAVDVLLEGATNPVAKESPSERKSLGQAPPRLPGRLPGLPSHTVRSSPRNTLIGAVKELASKQVERFHSLAIIEALKREYPEFGVTETKHISSQLNDLVKRGVLKVDQERKGAKPNIYRYSGG